MIVQRRVIFLEIIWDWLQINTAINIYLNPFNICLQHLFSLPYNDIK